MKNGNLVIKKKSLILFPLVFVFVLMSGSAVGLAHSQIFDPVFLLITLGCFLFRRRYKNITRGQIIAAVILLVCYIFNYVLNFENGAYQNAYMSYMMRIVSCFFFCCSLDADEFEKVFVSVMVVVAVYSLVFYIIGQTFGLISGVSTSWKYPIHFLYNYNGYLLHRNSGIFWEPGAYQFFLNMALLFNLKIKGFKFKQCINPANILFVVSIFTTKSTTGYLAFGVIAVFLIIKSWGELSQRQRLLMIIPMLVLAAALVYFIATSDVIVDKFTGKTGRSYSIRQNDFFSSIKPIMSHFWVGYGIGTNQYMEMASYYNIMSNSVGLFITALYLGAPYALYYSYRIIRNSVISQRKILVPFLVVIVLAMLTEDFYRYAIFFALAIGFGDKKICLKRSKN